VRLLLLLLLPPVQQLSSALCGAEHPHACVVGCVWAWWRALGGVCVKAAGRIACELQTCADVWQPPCWVPPPSPPPQLQRHNLHPAHEQFPAYTKQHFSQASRRCCCLGCPQHAVLLRGAGFCQWAISGGQRGEEGQRGLVGRGGKPGKLRGL
jgi:hypothetical protein